MLTATVSGSFHRHMDAITADVTRLTEAGVKVLSPADPRVVDQRGDFLFVASDRVRSVRMVQDRHLESIRASDFLWLVAPDGYVGQSASMELGFAVGCGVPIFGLNRPFDLTLRQYVRIVPSLDVARAQAELLTAGTSRTSEHFLIDPHDSLEKAHRVIAGIEKVLAKEPSKVGEVAAQQILAHRKVLSALLPGPSLLHS